MKIIISTFGEAPEGIVDGIKQFGCHKLILIVPDELKTKKATAGLREIEKTTKQMKIQLQKIKLPPYSLMENIQKIKEIIRNESQNEIILNVTGGRKTLSLAATLAGFVANPKEIVYITEEDKTTIQIPKFTIGEKLITKEKRSILGSISKNTTLIEIEKCLGDKGDISKNYYSMKKHLRELADEGLIEISKERPQTYTITPSGELVR